MSYKADVADLFNTKGAGYVIAGDGDAWHKRRQVRGFLLARLRASVVDPSRLRSETRTPFQSRPDQRQLPALNAFTFDETSERDSKDTLSRSLQLIVDVLAVGIGECVLGEFVKGADPQPVCHCIGCRLDDYALAIEGLFEIERMYGEGAGELVQDVTLVATNVEIEDRGDKRFGSIRLVFQVTYTTDTTGATWPD